VCVRAKCLQCNLRYEDSLRVHEFIQNMDSYITTEVLKLVNYFVRNSQVILRDPMEKSPC
jgi:hypothetical protein